MADINEALDTANKVINLGSVLVPAVITYIRQIRHKDGSVTTMAVVISRYDENDAGFQANIAADDAWFDKNGLTPDGKPKPPVT